MVRRRPDTTGGRRARRVDQAKAAFDRDNEGELGGDEHLFVLVQSLDLYDRYTAKIAECDQRLDQLRLVSA